MNFKNHCILIITTLLSYPIVGQVVQEPDENYFYGNENLSLTFEYPIGNLIKVSTGSEAKNFKGFLLGGFELEKHLEKDHSIYGSFALIMNFPVPVPAPYDCFDYCENGIAFSFALGARRTLKFNKESALSLGLGVSSNYYLWNLRTESYDSLYYVQEYQSFRNWGYGVNIDINYLMKFESNNASHTFGLGFDYSPTFINSKNITHSYLHTFNFKVLYKYPLTRKLIKGG